MCMFINKSLTAYTNIYYFISTVTLQYNAKYTKTMRSEKQTNIYGTKIE